MQSAQTDSTITFEIPVLSEQEFDSFDDAELALHTWNKQHGLEVTRAHNKKNKLKVIRQRDYQCDRNGKTQNNRGLRENERVRTARGTSKTGCSMKIRLEAVDPNNCAGKWKIIHLNGSKLHNHPASRDPSVHPGHRRRDLERHITGQISSLDLVASQLAVGVFSGGRCGNFATC
ncbi:FAR1 DNA-binding domain [Phytophthora infestans]|uniref:FAR1 DNA-binding domain n=1 Tax=Phytophthora infestans TaxID=4787 RepID=A0A8S9UDR0_PHYIN|nr:FAR1 DNA-binding domain [Phytophthora infestans]